MVDVQDRQVVVRPAIADRNMSIEDFYRYLLQKSLVGPRLWSTDLSDFVCCVVPVVASPSVYEKDLKVYTVAHGCGCPAAHVLGWLDNHGVVTVAAEWEHGTPIDLAQAVVETYRALALGDE